MRASVLRLGSLVALTGAAGAHCRCTQTITRDVAIIGGGASGTHAAIWLRDHGHSVVVVEKANQLGGHTAAFKDPATGKDINVGVQTWIEYGNSFDFPARMNVSTSGAMQFTPNTPNFVDMKTGRRVAGYEPPADGAKYPAIQRYIDAISQYEDIMLPGFFNFPDKIPEELVMPFGKFVEKYNLYDAVPQLWDSTVQGVGDPMNVPTFFIIQASAVPMARALVGTAAAAVPASGRLYDLYESIARFLGNDVLYASTVIRSTRTNSGVSLTVSGPRGKQTCIQAKRLLIAIQPTPRNMAPFSLDREERDVLGRFRFPTVYAGIIRHPALPKLNAYSNRSPSPGGLNHTIFPVASQVGHIGYIGGTEDLFQFTAVGTQQETASSMKLHIGKAIDAMIAAGTIERPKLQPGVKPQVTFSAFGDHGHMHAQVSAADLRNGFIKRLYGLQGKRNTWYTGAAFSSGFSTILWEYNKVLLPKVVEGL
ncbi:hypothetical protein VTJ83DRAFT_4069 [Remersonia thermophila]|uniref:FAD dependent oxidoreductase n=1 Tax=Remersonia thermophila TaxID=72144 RepID=A0ABR4DFT8_9PEZI